MRISDWSSDGCSSDLEGVEVEVFYVLAHLAVELGQAVQHPALQLRHLGSGDTLALVEAVEVAEQVAQRVAQAAVGIALMLQDFGPEAQVLLVVGGDDPEPKDVGALAVDHILRREGVALRLRHLLAALLLQDEAVRSEEHTSELQSL